MIDRTYDDNAFDTRAVRVGHGPTHEGEQSEPIFATASFRFDTAAQAAARFSGDEPGNVYSRFTNPTVRMFEQRLASLEGGACCVATASGMAAVSAVCFGLLKAGDHVVAAREIFGSTTQFFDNILRRFGVSVTYVGLTALAQWREAVRPGTRLCYLETPSNPLTRIADIGAIAEIAHAAGALLVVDNVYATPALQQPLSLGADIVVHSATKYIDGQGRCLGGAVVGDRATVGEAVYGYLRMAGPSMSPFNAWVFLKGLETLSLRMRRHSESALAVSRWLARQAGVARVHYPGLASHPEAALAARQQRAAGGVLSFQVEGGREAAWRVMDAVRVISITANLGDAKSTITHPATTTHGRLSEDKRRAMDIDQGLIRVSVGLEDPDDLIADLARGLSRR